MPEDIAIDENRQTSYDAVGDIETVTGQTAVEQALFLALFEEIDATPPAFTPDDIEDQRSDIEAVVSNHPYTRDPIRVEVSSRDPSTPSITYDVRTRRVAFPVTIE